MGAGTNSGKTGTTTSPSGVSSTMQENFVKVNPTVRRNIMNAQWRASTTASNVETFNLPGYGGARVEAAIAEDGQSAGWLASIWAANSNMTPVNGGRMFPNAAAAKEYAKRALAIRVEANRRNR